MADEWWWLWKLLPCHLWWSSLRGGRGCGRVHCKHLSSSPPCSKITLDPRAWKKSFKEKMVWFSSLFYCSVTNGFHAIIPKLYLHFHLLFENKWNSSKRKRKGKMEALNGWEARKKCGSLMQLIPDYTIVLFWAMQEDYGRKSRIRRRLLSNDSVVKIWDTSIKVCWECFW